MKPHVRVTFDPPEEVLHTYQMGDVFKPNSDTPPPMELVRRKDAPLIIYCWDRPGPTSSRPVR